MHEVDIWNVIYWRCHHLPMDIFNVSRHFLGLDFIHDKKPNMTFAGVKNHGSKVWKIKEIFWPTLSTCMSACQYLPIDCYCLSGGIWKSPIKSYKNTHGVLLVFFITRQQTFVEKSIILKKSVIVNAIRWIIMHEH